MRRHTGILLPVASLPSPFGIGDFGPSAYRFVDWLAAAGQRVWEVLPLLVPDEYGSPYASLSSFALNWMLVSPEALVAQRLLSPSVARRFRRTRERISYAQSNVEKRAVIGHAWFTFTSTPSRAHARSYARFVHQESFWLDDYATFQAIKDRFGGVPWWQWPAGLRDRRSHVLTRWKRAHRDEIDYVRFGQWLAHTQWHALKRYAHAHGVRILGDLPFFVPLDSVDVWVNPARVLLNSRRGMRVVSGAPPDLFQKNGQVWGDPLYNWQTMARERFAWWIARTGKALADYDDVRLDHFRGYHATWAVPLRAPNARSGSWLATPGDALLRRIRSCWPKRAFLAEDLGHITREVIALRDRFRLPGMRILQFGSRTHAMREHHPSRYPAHSAAYSGTHDMPTLREWRSRASREELTNLKRARMTNRERLLRVLLSSNSKTVMMQMADALDFGGEARINRPGTIDTKNWTWRLPPRRLSRTSAQALQRLTRSCGR
jgi:4-alpha-glucanotransferase